LLAFTFLLVLGKGLLLGFLGVVLRWPRPVTLRTALILAHGGEFGLLLLSQAVGTGLIAADLAQPLLGGVVLSMILAPLFIARHDAVVERLVTSHRSRTEAEQASWLAQQSETLDGHVLLLGCGRVGRQVAAVLEAADVPYLALEADPNRFQVAKRQGHRVVLADAGRLRLLDAVGIARARLVIATFSYPRLIERIIHHARQLNPNVKTLVSAADEADLPQLARAGVTAVFPENLAAGLALGNQALLLLGRSHEEAARVVTELRALLNPELEGHLGV
jgi:CPA2 family monovalent cation:H+ antiporter-2